MFFKKTLHVPLDEMVDYLVDYLEWYKMQSSPMHQICHDILLVEKDEIKKTLNLVFDKKIKDEDLDRIELIFKRDK